MTSITAFQKSSRLPAIDIIRAIALFGILVMNIQTYTLFAFLRPEQVYQLKLDSPAWYVPLQFIIHLLFKGEFYSIYCFLFGLGFYLMYQKNQQEGLGADRIFKRRLIVLLCFGLIHGLVFWFGDILHIYALLGFTLIFFNKKPVAVLVKWIGALLVAGITIQFGRTIFSMANPQLPGDQLEMDGLVMHVVNTWRYGSLAEVLSLQKLGVITLHIMDVAGGLTGYIHYELMFLIGLLAGKKNLFGIAAKLKLRLRDAAFKILPVAFLLKAISCLDVPSIHFMPAGLQAYEKLIMNVCGLVGTPLLAVVYILFMTSIFQEKRSRLWIWLGNTGKMGLTNYLAQTLVCMVLFYGYAGGLGGKLTLLQSFIPVISIYVLQVLYSNIWLRFYHSGPMELLWKKLTYERLKFPRLGRKSASLAGTAFPSGRMTLSVIKNKITGLF